MSGPIFYLIGILSDLKSKKIYARVSMSALVLPYSNVGEFKYYQRVFRRVTIDIE